MIAPMVGTWTVQIQDVRPFTIHGDLYYELHVVRDDEPGQLLGLKVPQHAAAVPPQSGQKVKVTFLMGQVTSVTSVS